MQGQFCEARPLVQVRGASDLKDLRQLVTVVYTSEKRLSVYDFSKDASDGPYIYRRGVVLGTKEDVRGTVPQSDDLVREVLHWDAKGASQTEISQFQKALAIDEQILRLQISMQHLVSMALLYSIQQLV